MVLNFRISQNMLTYPATAYLYLERSASSSALIGSLPPSNTMIGLTSCWRSSSTLLMQNAMCLPTQATLRRCCCASQSCNLDITMMEKGRAEGLGLLIRGSAFAKLPAAGVATPMQPAISVDCYSLGGQFPNMRLLGDHLEAGEQALYSHASGCCPALRLYRRLSGLLPQEKPPQLCEGDRRKLR